MGFWAVAVVATSRRNVYSGGGVAGGIGEGDAPGSEPEDLLHSLGRFLVSGFRADSLMLSLGGLGELRMARVISVLIIVAAGALMVTGQLWKTQKLTEV